MFLPRMGFGVTCVVLLLFTAATALWAADAPDPELSRKTPDQLYRDFEAFNTPQNLSRPFAGGQPLPFVQEQVRIVIELACRKTGDPSRLILRIADEYVDRINKLGPDGFRISPLQPLQLPIIRVLSMRADQPRFRKALEKLVKSPVLKDYARAQALVPLTEHKIRALDANKDPDASKRGALILTEMIGDLSFSDCLHVPARVSKVAYLTKAVAGPLPNSQWHALSAADSLPKRYARDFTFVLACSCADGVPGELPAPEKARVTEIIERWTKEYKPLIDKESYPSDVLAIALRSLAGKKGNEDLAKLMPAQPPPPVAIPHP